MLILKLKEPIKAINDSIELSFVGLTGSKPNLLTNKEMVYIKLQAFTDDNFPLTFETPLDSIIPDLSKRC